MEWIDLAVLVVAVGIVICVVRYQQLKKRAGQNGCGGGCSHCPMGGQCPSQEQKKEEEKENKEE